MPFHAPRNGLINASDNFWLHTGAMDACVIPLPWQYKVMIE
ncbi:hypothetical protein RD1_3836 [Roseobacter denitrificans OCh 114]|uniref:Uncharacterized protein n=1 Tax=Roseobacter denitrificans (strain ATCC 33942 / OCh 114) TaxID=375451 RepID=Q161P4_ROSDO|nr:hypothetical protein RD1_3836 [Roseobacter denitrificans OCh 114]